MCAQNRRPMQIKRNLQQDARQGTRKDREKMQTSCDTCANYEYDDDEEYYTCAINLDEDEMVRFMSVLTIQMGTSMRWYVIRCRKQKERK